MLRISEIVLLALGAQGVESLRMEPTSPPVVEATFDESYTIEQNSGGSTGLLVTGPQSERYFVQEGTALFDQLQTESSVPSSQWDVFVAEDTSSVVITRKDASTVTVAKPSEFNAADEETYTNDPQNFENVVSTEIALFWLRRVPLFFGLDFEADCKLQAFLTPDFYESTAGQLDKKLSNFAAQYAKLPSDYQHKSMPASRLGDRVAAASSANFRFNWLKKMASTAFLPGQGGLGSLRPVGA